MRGIRSAHAFDQFKTRNLRNMTIDVSALAPSRKATKNEALYHSTIEAAARLSSETEREAKESAPSVFSNEPQLFARPRPVRRPWFSDCLV